MAYYIIFFNNHAEVIDVVRYSTEEYEDFLKHLDRLKTDNSKIQYGYF